MRNTYLITGEGPRPEFHNTRLLIEGKVSDIYCTGALQIKGEKDVIKKGCFLKVVHDTLCCLSETTFISTQFSKVALL